VFADQIIAINGAQYHADGYILRFYSIANGLTFIVILLDSLLLSIGYRRQMLYGSLFAIGVALIAELIVVAPWGIRGIIAAKIATVSSLILFQLRMMPEKIRKPAISGLSKLAIPAGALAISLAATATLPLFARALICGSVVLVALFSLRIIRREELSMLRYIRLS
jgi:hypothetical protein